MQGIARSVGRLLVMALVMAAVLAGAAFVGLGATTAIAIGIVAAGVVGLLGVSRRPREATLTAHEEIAAMMVRPAAVPAFVPRPSQVTAVEAMAPPSGSPVDPEAFVPRWRRPSLLEARHSDPSRQAPAYRLPMRFGANDNANLDVRVVRYAVVPVLDRPDEVLGLQVSDLSSGDEVEVVSTSGAFVEVRCPNGDQGWVHRTTLGQRGAAAIASAGRQEADDALSALLSARGLS